RHPAQAARARRRGDRMTAKMKRREFITLLGGAGVAWPLAARAQQTKVYRIGALVVGNADVDSLRTELRETLRKSGYVEGQNLLFEFRSAEEELDSNFTGDNSHESNRGNGSGCGNGRDEAGGAVTCHQSEDRQGAWARRAADAARARRRGDRMKEG